MFRLKFLAIMAAFSIGMSAFCGCTGIKVPAGLSGMHGDTGTGRTFRRSFDQCNSFRDNHGGFDFFCQQGNEAD